MITLKIKYSTESSDLDIIQEYIKQYSSVLHCAYNLRFNNISEKDTEHQLKVLNNINLIGSFLKRCGQDYTPSMLLLQVVHFPLLIHIDIIHLRSF